MPITNASNLIRFADGTGAEIPRWIRKQLAAYGDDSASIKAFGHEVIVKLCERLIAGGAPTLHFYSMNQTEPTRQLVVDLRFKLISTSTYPSMNRFYIETELNTGNTIELTESVFHHWVRVLRAKVQEQAIFFNGKGGEYRRNSN